MPTTSRNGLLRSLYGGPAVLEDFADRLSHIWTFGILLLLACVVSWKQGWNKPIDCFCPAEFTDNMVTYTESICWNNRFITYPDKPDEENPHFEPTSAMTVVAHSYYSPHRNTQKISLYQWIPTILLIQAALFKLPNILYRVLQSLTGMGSEKVYNFTIGFRNLSVEDRSKLGRQLGRVVYNWCKQCENCSPWRMATFVWIIVKLLFIINVSLQLRAMNRILHTYNPPHENRTSYSDVILTNFFENNASTWRPSPVFPREISCLFDIRVLQRNIHSYSVTCQLPSNYFNEDVFTFLWIWFQFVLIVSGSSCFFWIVRRFVPVFRSRYLHFII